MLLGQAKLRHRCGKVNLDQMGVSSLVSRAHCTPGILYAADLPTTQPQAHQPARIPRPDGGSLGSRSALSSPQEGAQASDRQGAFQARGSLTATEQWPGARRIARPGELRRVQQTGRRRRLEHVDVLWTDNQAGHSRMGLIVPKFQSTAVARNLLRRRLREIWRRELMGIVPAWDVVVRARREAYGAGFGALRDQLLAWRRAVA